MKSDSYMTRALQARDPRFAKVLSRLGYRRADLRAEETPKDEKSPAQRRKRTKKVDS